MRPWVDEAKALINGHSRTYGHAIVDEAQDLSPMQLSMLARRCPSGSMTLLGDLAQAIGVWGNAQWSDVTAWLPAAEGVRMVELRIGYRSPAQVLELASRLLPEGPPMCAPPRPFGRVGARRAASRPAPRASSTPSWSKPNGCPRLGRPVTVVAAEGAKGLEFDAVVVVEPERIVAELERRADRGAGLRLLYVALTRPTQHLSIVTASPLPSALVPV